MTVMAQTAAKQFTGKVVQVIGPVIDIEFPEGLPRGMTVIDTGAAITVPVGPETLGRVLNVLGEPVDFPDRPVQSKERWPIHRHPPTLEQQSTELKMFETDIKDMSKSRAALVYGQMTEPPGARLRVGLSALTVAEYFRDAEGKDVLLFIDNIFRFTQAGSEVSALLGRMPSAVGYQPTLLTEMGELQERITSTKNGSITSVQAIYVPADD